MSIHAQLDRPAQGRNSLTLLNNGRHAWVSDVGKTLGGLDAAPDPHDLLDSALAACTALTLELYLRRKGWAVRAVQVDIEHDEAKADDGRVRYLLKRRIHIEGEVADDERARLLEIANKCPIHSILSGEIHIDSELV